MNESTRVDDVVEYGGVNYRYVTSVAASRREGGSLAAPAHSEGSPVLMSWGKDGSAGVFGAESRNSASLSGFSTQFFGAAGGSGELIRSGDTSQARVIAERLKSETVTLWIALYEPIQ